MSDALYEVFVPKNRAIAAKFADVIPGTAETVRELRALGLKIAKKFPPAFSEGRGVVDARRVDKSPK